MKAIKNHKKRVLPTEYTKHIRPHRMTPNHIDRMHEDKCLELYSRIALDSVDSIGQGKQPFSF